MVRLLLIRHAATEASEKGVLLGATDVAASDKGLQDLMRQKVHLSLYNPDVWYCSPMRRAKQTVEKLQELGIAGESVVRDERLREIDFGSWEQKSFSEIRETNPELIPAWSKYDNFVFPGGESIEGFIKRVTEILEMFRQSRNKEIAVVTHGGVIRTLICLALGFGARNYLLFTVGPASLTILDLYPEGAVLSGLNI